MSSNKALPQPYTGCIPARELDAGSLNRLRKNLAWLDVDLMAGEMRGRDCQTGKLFSYASPESLVPQEHPLRAIRLLVTAALERRSPAFAAIYADSGRPSIAPEKLLRALLLQALFTVRSERQLMRQITHNMLFR